MQQTTKELLDQFQDLDWFHAGGTPIHEEGIVSVSRSIDAVTHVTSGYLEMIGYQNGIALENAVTKSARGMKKRWKEAEAELRPLAHSIVIEKLRPQREKRSPGRSRVGRN